MRMLPEDLQRSVEYKYSRRKIESYVLKEIEESQEVQKRIDIAAINLNEWMNKDHYSSKNERLAQLVDMDMRELVVEILLQIFQLRKPETFTSLVGRTASLLSYSAKMEGIKTLSEILAIMCHADLFTIFKNGPDNSLHVKNDFRLSDKTMKFIDQTKYLPPMVCEPKIVKNNFQAGYLTFDDSLILGSGNHHSGEICLDSINKFNQIPLSLDLDLLKRYEETSKKELDTPEKEKAYNKMVQDSYRVDVDLVNQGNRFFLNHKVDKRGRTYAQGYHVNTQGSSYKKAIINFHEKELIEGVPS